MLGGVRSMTVTLKQQREEFPAPSVAVQQTGVVPIGNVLPEAGLQAIDGVASHVSDAVTEYVTVAPSGLVQSVAMSGGHAMLGGVKSVTVTLKQQREEFPASSVAVQHTAVFPSGKVSPDEGVQTIDTLGSHVSDAVTE